MKAKFLKTEATPVDVSLRLPAGRTSVSDAVCVLAWVDGAARTLKADPILETASGEAEVEAARTSDEAEGTGRRRSVGSISKRSREA